MRNFSNQLAAFASPKGLLYFAWPNSNEEKGNGVRFIIHDRGNGRVVLEAVTGGFLTVVGQGLSGDVRIMKAETPASLFQWQDMLKHQFMLLSLQTNRYIGLDPKTHEPYGADWAGAEPDRKNGTVLIWEETSVIK